MMHQCRICGVELFKKPGPGRWPKSCAEHRATRTTPLETAEERSARARLAATKRWETWAASPELRARAAEHAMRGAEARWQLRESRGFACGHSAPNYRGPVQRKCAECKAAILVCVAEGCEEALVRADGRGRDPKWCDYHRTENRRSQSRDSPNRECSKSDCVRPVRARGVCSMHYKAEARADGRIASEPWNDRRRNNHQARRALLKGGRNGDPVMLADIVARDNAMCGICSEPVDLAIAWPDPLSKSIDHIVPVSRGGAHDPSNCQLAHLRCNISKGDRVAA